MLSLARELLRNAAKHAGATAVAVAVRVDAEAACVLEVTDDGVGIAPERLREALGAGPHRRSPPAASARRRSAARFRVGPRDDGERGTQAVAYCPRP